MADDVILPGEGDLVAADLIAGVYHQRMKLQLGADGSAQDVAPGQATMANSLPVVVASDQTALPVSGTLTVTGPLTDTQLRNSAVPVSLATLPALAAGTNGIGKLTANSGVDIGDVDVTSIAAGENHLGEVDSSILMPSATPPLDTAIYAPGDVLFDATAVASALRVAGKKAILHSAVFLDKDDQGVPFDLVLLRSNVSVGTANAAPSISDANAAEILGVVSIISSDWIDFGGCRIATKTNIGLTVEAASGTTIYVAAITRGTPTHTASGIVIKLGLLG